MQSQGIGKILLNYAKDKRNKLYLNVYQKNARAISFYKREGFVIQHSGLDEATGEKDYVMTWQHKLIILWTLAALDDISYVSVIVCFIAFLINDIYGFLNWRKMQKRQSQL